MSEQEFTVRIPARNEKKNYHIMKFNANLKVDVGKWSQVQFMDNYISRVDILAFQPLSNKVII